MAYYAHTKEDPDSGNTLSPEHWQRLADHLTAVECAAGRFASKFGAEKLGKIIGLAHDIGKYSEEFQKRLAGQKVKVDHMSAGAQEVDKRYPRIGKALAYTIAGHHGGLPDGNKGDPANLPERLSNKELPDYKAFVAEIDLPGLSGTDLADMPKGAAGMESFSFSFCIRMLYSCLVDADFLDTEGFMDVERHGFRPQYPTMDTLYGRLQKKMQDISRKSKENHTEINSNRQKILDRCLEMAASKPGFYTLTVPTGGGKTYSSLAFGLKHAVEYKKDRLIYVIPFTSIIEQNAEVFRDALGTDSVVLEHHSNFEYPESCFTDWSREEKVHRLASENWDMPVVVTTAVQFFESLFANKGSRCRKLHNIVNSVIVLDEAQMLPRAYMKPCLWALAELVLNYKATVVFCTATQPAIKEQLPGVIHPVEIMENPIQLHNDFKRVNVGFIGFKEDSDLALEISGREQALAIVNTRRHAKMLFDQLIRNRPEDSYHLSARMYPAHRKKVLHEIRQKLKAGESCRVISTQLIEAGVDVDFPVVFRSMAGIDSIAQAAGRCNREGKRKQGQVIVFDPERHGMPEKGGFEEAAAITRETVRQLSSLKDDILSLEAIEYYFYHLLDEEKLDEKKILKIIMDGGRGMAFPFATIAKEFQLIDSSMVSIIIPWEEEASRFVRNAEKSFYPASMTRIFQPYTVQIYPYEFNALQKEGVVRSIGDVLQVLTDNSFYDSQVGLKDAKEVLAPQEVYLF